jgi:hypothetical protein
MKRVKFFIFIILNLNGESFIKELAEDNIEKKISYSEVQNIINDNKQLRSKVKVLETENQKIKKELEGLDIQVLSKLKEELIESRRNFKDLQERFTLLQKKNDKMSSKFQEMQIVSHEDLVLKDENNRLKKANLNLQQEIDLNKDKRTFIQKKEDAFKKRREKKIEKSNYIKSHREKIKLQRMEKKGFLTIIESVHLESSY